MFGKPDFKVRGFAGGRHPAGVKLGALLMETDHQGETSASVEVDVWKKRMERGEVSKCELIDLRPLGKLTNLDIYEHTEIPWSHLARSCAEGDLK